MTKSGLCLSYCYKYDPSMGAAVAFAVLFFLTTFCHGYQLIRTRTWYLIPLFIGGIFEFVGYIARAESSSQSPDFTLGPYIVQTILLLVAPALFAASIYMELGRIILLVEGESRAMIKKRWLTKIFVAGDILSFLAQSAGGAIMAGKTQESVTNGSHIVIAGLAIQLIFFGFFLLVAVSFNISIVKAPTTRSISTTIPWRKHLITLYAASILIMIRSIFRVAEYVQGGDGYTLKHEVFLYIFDSVLMLGVMIIFNIIHPSEVRALLRGGQWSSSVIKLNTFERLESF
ncbi:MAG: hypothetical protein M1819_004027 [Sarea resinae]|nr:MAG: hypothetical protein M1819_004027 [Sarea resinae]